MVTRILLSKYLVLIVAKLTITWISSTKGVRWKSCNAACPGHTICYKLEYGRHLALRLAARCVPPTSKIASLDNQEKINSWVSISLLYGYGARLRCLSGRWSSAITYKQLFDEVGKILITEFNNYFIV